MPTIRGTDGPYRLFFYSFDCAEPPHVHVRRDRQVCKFWLERVALSTNDGFTANEVNRIRRLVLDHLPRIMEAWHEHCGDA